MKLDLAEYNQEQVKLLLKDALSEFMRARLCSDNPEQDEIGVNAYVNLRYSEQSEKFKTDKMNEVRERVALARELKKLINNLED